LKRDSRAAVGASFGTYDTGHTAAPSGWRSASLLGRRVLGRAADAYTWLAWNLLKAFKLFFGDDPLPTDALAETAVSTELANALRGKPKSLGYFFNSHEPHTSRII
jgi:hypothetical protein